RDHHLVGSEDLAALPDAVRAAGVDLVSTTGPGHHTGHRREGVDLRARLLGEVEVVLDERVLRSHTATRHTAAALGAAGAVGAGSTEERVGHRPAGLVEEHTDRGGRVGVAHTHLVGDLDRKSVV